MGLCTPQKPMRNHISRIRYVSDLISHQIISYFFGLDLPCHRHCFLATECCHDNNRKSKKKEIASKEISISCNLKKHYAFTEDIFQFSPVLFKLYGKMKALQISGTQWKYSRKTKYSYISLISQRSP